MGFLRKAIVAAGIGLAAIVITACGSEGQLLSTTQAAQLNAHLNAASTALAEHNCAGARTALTAFQTYVGQLGDVDATLVHNLNQGATTIEQLTSTSCAGWSLTKTRARQHRKKREHSKTTGQHTTTTNTVTTSTTPSTTVPIITSTTGGQGLGTGTDTIGAGSTSTPAPPASPATPPPVETPPPAQTPPPVETPSATPGVGTSGGASSDATSSGSSASGDAASGS